MTTNYDDYILNKYSIKTLYLVRLNLRGHTSSEL